MSRQVQFIRGNTQCINHYVGPLGSFAINLDDWSIHIQDGVTPGGHIVTGTGGNYNDSNVAAYLPTDVTIIDIQNAITNLQLGIVDLGNFTFDADRLYDINGFTLENSDATHGYTSRLAIPVNGSGTAELVNFYGNVNLTAGYNNGDINTWAFNKDGNITFPDTTVQTTAYPGPQDLSAYATTSNVSSAIDVAINNLIGSAPGTLDTLGEIAASLANNASLSATLTSSINAIASNVSVLQTAGYITQANIPANVSYFVNDKGYITNANLVGYATTTDVTTANTAMKGYIDSISFNTSYSNSNVASYLVTYNYVTSANLTGYATETYVNTANSAMKAYVDSISFNTSYGNSNVASYLTSHNYLTVNDIPANVSYFINDSGYITMANLAGYATTTDVSTANTAMKAYVDSISVSSSYSDANVAEYLTTYNYITSANLVGYATETYVTNAIANITVTPVLSISDLTDVDTTSTPPGVGQVLKWNGTNWVPAIDSTTGGGGTDADTLDGQHADYYLNYNNFANVPTVVSHFTNDAGYITTANLAGYATNANVANIVVISSSSPTITAYSPLWYNTVDGRTYVAYQNTWVDANPPVIANLAPYAYTTDVSNANVAMKGYVDSVSFNSSYSNANVISYLTVNAISPYSNANVASYLPVYGGNVLAANVFLTGNVQGYNELTVGVSNATVYPYLTAMFTTNGNGYSQINTQNLSSLGQASTDFVATANNGNDSTYFVDLGIASSGYNVNNAINSTQMGTALAPNDAYLFTVGNTAATAGGNLLVGTATTGKQIKFMAGTSNVVANISTAGLTVTQGNITGNTGGFAIGYRDIPQVSWAANTSITTTDAGKHYYSTASGTLNLTIANNASQSFSIGAAINIMNGGTGNVILTPASGVTLYLAGNATAGGRTLSSYGAATITKVATDTWWVVGVGLT